MKVCNGVKTQITHFRCLRISPLIFATVQNFALDNLRDQQILIPTCEWGWVVMVPLLNTTLEVEHSPGMVCTGCSVWDCNKILIQLWTIVTFTQTAHCATLSPASLYQGQLEHYLASCIISIYLFSILHHYLCSILHLASRICITHHAITQYLTLSNTSLYSKHYV